MKEPFVIDGEVIGYSDENDVVTITDEDIIKETLENIEAEYQK